MSKARAALEQAGIRDVSRETLEALECFHALFGQWSKRINLVAASTGDAFWTRHVADSAQLIALRPDASRWVDLGSGGGFPGMVLAILAGRHAGARVDLVESNRKKAAFLQAVRAAAAPAAHVHAARIEEVLATLPAPEVVTARALASLPELLAHVEPWLAGSTVGLFHKGRGYREELEESRAHWSFDLVEHTSIAAVDSVILSISNLKRRADPIS